MLAKAIVGAAIGDFCGAPINLGFSAAVLAKQHGSQGTIFQLDMIIETHPSFVLSCDANTCHSVCKLFLCLSLLVEPLQTMIRPGQSASL
jgi:hypothetical protein